LAVGRAAFTGEDQLHDPAPHDVEVALRRLAPTLALLALGLGLVAAPANLVSHVALNPDFVHFETSHVHPAALTPDGTKLLVVNTPDNRLSVFDVTGATPVRIAEIPVGLEPVSVAARTNGEAWVVNNLSDDVSIVDLALSHTVATLHVGDEPSDVVFAGAANKAYVSVSQEDAVKVYDPANLAAAPVVIPIPGRMPRALARNFNGSQVVVDVFHSSAQSTALSAAEAGDSLPPPVPAQDPTLPAAPKTGLVVKRSSGGWIDQAGHLWNSKIRYQVPLNEVVYVGTGTNTVLGLRGDIATIMLGAAASPLDSAVAVTGTYSILEQRLEPNLRGHFTEQRLAIISHFTGARTEVQLNPHINYAVSPGPASETDSSLGLPTGVCWSPDAQRLYVTSLASDKLGVFNTSGTPLARVRTVAGPTGVVADPARARLYVIGRFHNQLQVLSTANFASLAVVPIGFDPTPDAIVNGRKFFYGGFTSGHGDQACASCHLFGDMDNLAWELGNPLGTMAPAPPNQTDPLLQGYHPMKGPMVTQSLRGLPNTGLFHWRGDRADLGAFNPAFVSLMGRAAQLPDSEMSAFADFVLPLVYPPNPNENLDRTMPDAPADQPSALRGQTFFMNTAVDGPLRCVDCHALPTGTNGQVIDHFALQEAQDMKVPQLRNLYKKSGFKDTIGVVNKRGFGYTHDGSIDNLFDFLKFPGFNFGSPASVADANRRDVERFLLDFDTGLAPAVGCQITFDGGNNGDATLNARLDTLVAQANGGHCDLIAKGRVGVTPRGWLYQGGAWKSDVATDAPLARATLIALASAGHQVTITGVPAGSGTRMGIDRDRDGFLDGDELAAGTDPGDPASHPSVSVLGAPPAPIGLRAVRPNPFRVSTAIDFALARPGVVEVAVYDVLGRRTRDLVARGPMAAGAHSATWSGDTDGGRPAAPGVYFVRLEIDGRAWRRAVVRMH
jgi:YVTN family beta-propeller protein